MSDEYEYMDTLADAVRWRSIQKILKDWVAEVAFQAPGLLSDGITPMCGKFETEELWRQANKLLNVKPDPHSERAAREGVSRQEAKLRNHGKPYDTPTVLKLGEKTRVVDISKACPHCGYRHPPDGMCV